MKKWITVENTDNFVSKKKLKVVSLFSGCGGKDLGMVGDFTVFNKHYGKNPFNLVFANDIIQHACNTYKDNFHEDILCDDINNVDEKELPKADVVIGGFPCQDFSYAGNRKGFDSQRGLLYLQMKRIIDGVKPILFVAENVEGLTNLNGTSSIEKIKSDFAASGYTVEYNLFNAADYGVPQTRKRVIIIGIRNDICKNNEIPYPLPIRGPKTNLPWMTSKEAIDDLWNKIGTGIPNHSEKDYSRAKFYPDGKGQGNCRIKADAPAPTIRSEHHGNIEGHYRCIGDVETNDVTKWRRLSVRECARLQSFPDNFVFPSSASSAYKEIGNAVPPIFAWFIFRAIAIYFKEQGLL